MHPIPRRYYETAVPKLAVAWRRGEKGEEEFLDQRIIDIPHSNKWGCRGYKLCVGHGSISNSIQKFKSLAIDTRAMYTSCEVMGCLYDGSKASKKEAFGSRSAIQSIFSRQGKNRRLLSGGLLKKSINK
ncbi:hypothetical protein HAX54_012338 [Datura stramonium]|uniref:Uncharacterized protein n=1 Tax=Datura stramonium TaxID=4076 RepID=A0ABS8TJL5_DATST|nr:hypothetical protein [Datura stramonium]